MSNNPGKTSLWCRTKYSKKEGTAASLMKNSTSDWARRGAEGASTFADNIPTLPDTKTLIKPVTVNEAREAILVNWYL